MIAFLKNSDTLLSKGIRAVTGSRYSHAELVFDNGIHYTALTRLTGTTGVVKIQYDKYTDDWDFVTVKVTEEEYNQALKIADGLVGKPYNYTGILFTQLFGFGISGNDEFFCSEFVAYVLHKSKILKLKNKMLSVYNPGLLYRELMVKIKHTSEKKMTFRFNKKEYAPESYDPTELYDPNSW